MAYSSLLSLSLCFLLLFHNSVATQESRISSSDKRRQQQWQQNACQLNRINAVEPSRRIRSEAGVTEIWDENDRQFQCTGVVAMRHTIQQRGLLLPQYANGPKLIYVVQGHGIQGAVLPGCPGTYQSPTESEQWYGAGQEQSQSRTDRHQKVRQIRQGQVIALPQGVAQWIYNNGRNPLVLVQIIDTSNSANQLDQNHRSFFLAGNPQQEIQSQKGRFSQGRTGQSQSQSQSSRRKSGNVLSGMDEQILAEAFNINTDLARKLRGEDDFRGVIVNVEYDLEMLLPKRSQEEEREESEEGAIKELEGSAEGRYNGLEETFCTARLTHNVDRPSEADVFNPQAGRLTSINNHNLPILRFLRLSIQKAVLYRNAIMTPYWNINSHSIRYFTSGNGRVQIVNENGDSVFDGQVRRGQMLTVPQNFVVITKASSQGLEWVAFKTTDNAEMNQLAGRVSAIRSLPEQVLAHAYQVSVEDARRLKENRREVTMLSPGFRSRP